MPNNKIKNESGDHEYFTITPRLVWALSRSPYDYTLWCVIKDIAGEHGECYLSTPDLARLAMMSSGKVSECRKHLLSCGLLGGEMRKDPEYPQPVWHLTIKNVWAKNTKWCEMYPKISDRIRYKIGQPEDPSPDESKEPSPGERGPSLGEMGTSPHETKKNHNNNHEEDSSPAGEATTHHRSERQIALSDLENFFSSKTNIPLPKRETQQQKKAGSVRWWGPLGNIWELVGKDVSKAHLVIEEAVDKMREDHLTISAPQSIEQVCIAIVSEETESMVVSV